jgi:hypothetical protein
MKNTYSRAFSYALRVVRTLSPQDENNPPVVKLVAKNDKSASPETPKLQGSN